MCNRILNHALQLLVLGLLLQGCVSTDSIPVETATGESTGLLKSMVVMGATREAGRLQQEGSLDQGVVILENLVLKYPAECNSMVQLGVLYRKQYQFEKAAEIYEQCLTLQPQHTAALKNAGILNELYLGNLILAEQYYQRYVSAGGDDAPEVASWIRVIKRHLERDRQVAGEYR